MIVVNGDDKVLGGCERRVEGVFDDAVNDEDGEEAVLACCAANADVSS